MTTITWFESYWAGMKSEVGGKAASLGEMTGAGLPVPPGFAVCTSAYRRARDESDLDAQIARIDPLLVLPVRPQDAPSASPSSIPGAPYPSMVPELYPGG